MSDTVQQVKDRLSITDLVSGYVKLERSGGSLRARCPFHAEKSPSFFVSPERGTYHCFGCGVGGDVFAFYQNIEGVDFKTALKALAERVGVEVVYRSGEREEKDAKARLYEVMEAATLFYISKLGDDARAYLRERGIEDSTIKDFRLGFAGNGWSELSEHLRSKKYTDAEIIEAGLAKKNERGGTTDKFRNRIMFPISDSAGRVVAFSGRTFGPDASPEAPKYLNSPETPLYYKSRILYGYDKAKMPMRKLNCAVLVEGQMDLLASHQAGWGNTVAVSGTAFTQEHATLIKRMTDNLVLALDADAAGIKAAGRAAREALAQGLNVKVVRIAEGKDPADLIKAQGADVWKVAIRDAKDIITFLLDVLQEHAPEQDKFRRSVELVVLPFIADVRSPIAREQYIREIAGRLGVSEDAVARATAQMPAAPGARQHRKEETGTGAAKPRPCTDLATLAFALLIWQESLSKPALDVKGFRADVREALGDDAFIAFEALSDSEKEALRFEAEHKHGRSTALADEARDLVRRILRERLTAELAQATARLDMVRDAEEEARLSEDVKLLTTRLAKTHKSV